jgi:hypothetical protein
MTQLCGDGGVRANVVRGGEIGGGGVSGWRLLEGKCGARGRTGRHGCADVGRRRDGVASVRCGWWHHVGFREGYRWERVRGVVWAREGGAEGGAGEVA